MACGCAKIKAVTECYGTRLTECTGTGTQRGCTDPSIEPQQYTITSVSSVSSITMLRCTLALICCLSLLASPAIAHPWKHINKFKLSQCGLHPMAPTDSHPGKISTDPKVSWIVAAGTKLLTPARDRLCPGASYTVTANIGVARHSLLTTTIGSFQKGPEPACGRSYFTPDRKKSNKVTAVLQLPCNAKGSVVLEVSHSDEGVAYFKSKLTYRVNAACASPLCKLG